MTLQAIPGERGLPLFGHSLAYIKDCNGWYDSMIAKHGNLFKGRFLHGEVIHMLSPDANEFVLLDIEKNFSSRKAWNQILQRLFPNGLMLRDGDDHRFHRRLLSAPFKSAALKAYVASMNPDIATSVAKWQSQQQFLFYPAIKDLTLNLACKIFIGETHEDDVAEINQAFVDLVAAAMALVRYPIFGNKFQRGLEGRAVLEEYFSSRIEQKRQSNDDDMFAEICRAQAEDGSGFSNQDIVDHMIFLMMAAHDTTTSSLSSVCFALAKHPEWQEKIRDEITALDKPDLLYDDMPGFDAAGLVLKESLRLYPPLPTIPRVALKDCQFKEYLIPKGSMVSVSPYVTHRDPEIWSEPNEFDPQRFSLNRAEEKRHKHAWIPFGGGAHKCLGIKFAELQVKLVLFHVLKSYRLEVEPGYEMPYQPAPIGKPADSLPLKLVPLSSLEDD